MTDPHPDRAGGTGAAFAPRSSRMIGSIVNTIASARETALRPAVDVQGIDALSPTTDKVYEPPSSGAQSRHAAPGIVGGNADVGAPPAAPPAAPAAGAPAGAVNASAGHAVRPSGLTAAFAAAATSTASALGPAAPAAAVGGGMGGGAVSTTTTIPPPSATGSWEKAFGSGGADGPVTIPPPGGGTSWDTGMGSAGSTGSRGAGGGDHVVVAGAWGAPAPPAVSVNDLYTSASAEWKQWGSAGSSTGGSAGSGAASGGGGGGGGAGVNSSSAIGLLGAHASNGMASSVGSSVGSVGSVGSLGSVGSVGSMGSAGGSAPSTHPLMAHSASSWPNRDMRAAAPAQVDSLSYGMQHLSVQPAMAVPSARSVPLQSGVGVGVGVAPMHQYAGYGHPHPHAHAHHAHAPVQAPMLSSVSPPYTYSEHPHGEHPSRTLFVRNINSSVEDHELRALFERYGLVRSMYTQCKHRGFVMVSYFDLRHAKNAKHRLQDMLLRGRCLDVHYSIPKENSSERDANQGTLVVFNLHPSTTNAELMRIFGAFGDVKEIRETPNKRFHKFIEFYDTRHAQEAMRYLNKTEIKGKKIKIELSRPGGSRKNAQYQQAQKQAQQAAAAQAQPAGAQPVPPAQGMQASPPYHAHAHAHAHHVHHAHHAHLQHAYGAAGGDMPAYGSAPAGMPSGMALAQQHVRGPAPQRGMYVMDLATGGGTAGGGGGGGAVTGPSNVHAPAFVPGGAYMSGSGAGVPARSFSPTRGRSPGPVYTGGGGGAGGVRRHGSVERLRRSSPGSSPERGRRDRRGFGSVPSSPTAGGGKGGRRRGSSADNAFFTLDLSKIRAGDDTRTTLMVRNIPNKYTQKMLLQSIDVNFRGQYDFFYLPIDFKNRCNVGYLFINFIDPQTIPPFFNQFNGKKWEKFNSEKVCEITYGRIQGKTHLIEHFRNSSLMCEEEECRPIIFHSEGALKGTQEPFPVGPNARPRRRSSGSDSSRTSRDRGGSDPRAGNGRR